MRLSHRTLVGKRLTACFLLMLVTGGCLAEGTNFRFKNSTDGLVDVTFNGEVIARRLAPGKTATYPTIDFETDFPATVRAYDERGDLIFERTYQLSEARASSFRFEITTED